jgi:hypothetical protein
MIYVFSFVKIEWNQKDLFLSPPLPHVEGNFPPLNISQQNFFSTKIEGKSNLESRKNFPRETFTCLSSGEEEAYLQGPFGEKFLT